MPIPDELRTARLLLRSWLPTDAASVGPVLDANWPRLRPWIPARAAEPTTIDVLTQRLADFAANFAADREWRYGIFTLDTSIALGELSLFARSAAGRVPLVEGDRVEIGYWLRADFAGKGFATEAAQAVLDAAAHIPQFQHAEIRCDARNLSSGAVAQRLGFTLAETIAGTQYWTHAFAR